MSKSTHTSDSRAVLLIEATEQQVSRLQSEMSGWLWEQAPNNWPFDLEAKPSDRGFDAVIVFAGKERDDRVIDTCRLLCENKSIEGVPLLLAASRYQMSLVNKLRQLPLVDFIFTPIEEDALLDKIRKNTDVTA